MEKADNGVASESPQPEPLQTETLNKEIARLRGLREDVLLLRFHLARRTDITKVIDETDRLISETALKSSLEILERVERKDIPPTGHVAAAASSLMYTVDALVHGARMAVELDGTGESPPPITPETLRASLPERDIAAALGEKLPAGKRKAATIVRTYLKRQTRYTIIFFVLALLFHFGVTSSLVPKDIIVLDVIMIPASAFLWAVVGSLVWILIRFRRFGAAFAFDPSQAEVYAARVFSGSVLSAVLLYFVFGGKKPWAENWQVNLPLWAFVLGYAGRLQVELLGSMVERVQSGLQKATRASVYEKSSVSSKKKDDESPEESAGKEPKSPPPPLGNLPKPEEEAPGETVPEDK